MASTKTRSGARGRGGHSKSLFPFRSTPLVQALTQIHVDLVEMDVSHALIGGLAVSARAEPRTTRDIDLAVAVESDIQAEKVIFRLQQQGYRVDGLIEQTKTKRLSTARLRVRLKEQVEVIVDLLFASSGIEVEIVKRATQIEALPGLVLPVAGIADLLALKVLARNDRSRPQDADDLRALLLVADRRVRLQVPKILALIEARGFARGRRLLEHWERAVGALGKPDTRTGFRKRKT